MSQIEWRHGPDGARSAVPRHLAVRPAGSEARPGRDRTRGTARACFATLVLAGVTLLGACDSGPKGPGTWSAAVVAPQPVGAVLLEVSGGGVTGFESQGGVRTVDGAVVGKPGTRRVIVLSGDGGPVRFGVRTADLAGPRPTITVVSAAGPDNAPLATAGIEVRIGN